MAAANPIDVEQFTPVLKNVYLNVRKKAFPMLTPLLAAARRGGPDSVRYAGNDLFFDVKLDRRGGFIASAQGFLPVSKIAREKQGRLGVTRTYAQAAVDGLALRVSAQQRGAFISVAKKVTEDIMESWQLNQERVLMGDSRGIRAVMDSRTSDTVKVLDNPYGIADAGPGNLHLTVGEDIAIVDSADFTVHGKAQITDISLSGDLATVTVDSAITGDAAGDFVVTATPSSRSSTDTSFGVEPHGIESITDPSTNFATFEGINDDRWAAYTTTASTIDESNLMAFLNTIRARGGVDWRRDPRNMLLLTTTGIWQQYGESLTGLRRFAAPEMTLQGGFTGVKVGNAVLLDDPWAPRGRLYAIHTPDTIFIDLMDFGEMSFEDSPEWNKSDTQDQYTVNFGAYWNYGVLKRNTHGAITGITDDSNFSPVF